MVPKHAVDLEAINVAELYAGEHHALVRTADGDLMSFGRPAYGRLGRADVDANANEGVGPGKLMIEGLEGPIGGAAAGSGVSGCFSAQMCGLWMCGFGENSQLGQGDDDTDRVEMARVKRTKVFNEVEIAQLQVGGQHVVMLAVPTEPPPPAAAAPPAESSESAGKGKGKAAPAKAKVAKKAEPEEPAEETAAEEKPAEDVNMDDGEDAADEVGSGADEAEAGSGADAAVAASGSDAS